MGRIDWHSHPLTRNTPVDADYRSTQNGRVHYDRIAV
ncbi:MAG TPA: DUF6434 domain-containing protein [Magnetospirillaceae bacterium]|nr:DUF6434 domain-containing protein [Magnetospirillaceae bacterium]